MLLKHSAEAGPWLVKGLSADDRQKRFLCAFVLASGGHADHAAQVVPLLLPRLSHNRTPNDGLMSASALFRLGEVVEPYLFEARPESDDQAGPLIDLILRDLHDPPDTQAKLWSRSQKGLLSDLYHDPVYEYRFGRYGHRFRGLRD